MFKTAYLTLDQLLLDPLNPRFTTRENKNFSEPETIDYLIEYEELLTLANQINDYGGFTPGERIIVMEENNKYIVLEGNRRTAALKLLNNPSLSKLNKKIPKITKECSAFINSIPVDIVESREAADRALVTRHIDGIRVWSQFSKMKFYKRMFDSGKTLDEISSISPDSKLAIKRELHRYSILINILENYARFTKSESFISTAVDAKLPTDLLLTRMYSFYTDKDGLNLKFNNTSYELELPKDKQKKDLLLHILVLIAKMYWEEEVIDTRILNTKTDIYNFFLGKDIKDKIKFPINETHEDLVELIELYKNTKDIDNNIDELGNVKSDDKSDEINSSNKTNTKSIVSNNSEHTDVKSSESNNSEHTGVKSSEPNDSGHADVKSSDSLIRSNQGRKRKDPKDYDSLLKAYPFKNKYRKNNRINQTIKELEKIQYKDFGISTNYLIRSLLESYAYEYTVIFSSKDHHDPHKLKGLTIKNFSNKDLNEIYLNHLAEHIGNYSVKYLPVKDRIISLFSKSNQMSITQKLNQFVHSPNFNPSYLENLVSWESVCFIITVIDEILFSAGQN